VEPSEVEVRLAHHPAVTQAAVVARDDGLVAYIVGARPPAEELRRFLSESLPDHMIPSLFVPIDALPLTPSGKVDRRALPDPASLDPQREADYVAPRDELEAQIAEIWAELVGVERVGVADDFFAL